MKILIGVLAVVILGMTAILVDSLGRSDLVFAGQGQSETSKMVAGLVDMDGNDVVGSNYSVAKTGLGLYTVTFTTPFRSTPVVVCSAGDPGINDDNVCNTSFITSGSVSISTWDTGWPHITCCNNPEDSQFSFIAVGRH